MTTPGQSDTRIVVIERNDQNWLYRDGEQNYLQAEKRGDGLELLVGYSGISEEGQHAITLPGAVAASLIEWVRR